MPTAPVAHAWEPIQAPPKPAALAVEAVRVLSRFWHTQRKQLESHGAWQPFSERMARWWCIETGIIENIFDLSLGATMALVEQGFAASLIAHGDSNLDPEELVVILGDHREALDVVMDLVGGARELTVGWIKELHALITRSQKTSTARDPSGKLIQVPLLHGEYKKAPNNPLQADGRIHEYCPPQQVASEMDRLVALYGALPAELPEVRAAWLHHAFTQIHPFQDGNGRVARALASIDLIRAGLFPLLVDRTDRDRSYLPALRRADEGDLGPLVDFFSRCVERVLLRAISEAQGTVGEAASLAKVVQAAKAKVAARGQFAGEARSLMAASIAKLAKQAKAQLGAAAAKVQAEVPGVTFKVTTSTRTTEHWFRTQIVSVAKHHGYWADLHESRTWARLQLSDGGATDVVVVLHFVGNPSPGTCVAAVFLDHRDAGERPGTNPPTLLAVEPLSLYPEEDEEAQRARFAKWLTDAIPQALAQWTRYL